MGWLGEFVAQSTWLKTVFAAVLIVGVIYVCRWAKDREVRGWGKGKRKGPLHDLE